MFHQFQSENAMHPSTPTRKHRLGEDGGLVTPSRRPLSAVTESDLNASQGPRSGAFSSSSTTPNKTQRHFVSVHSTHPIPANMIHGGPFHSSNFLSTTQTRQLARLLVHIRERRVFRDKEVRSAFYRWLSISLRMSRTRHNSDESEVKSAFATPKKRKVDTESEKNILHTNSSGKGHSSNSSSNSNSNSNSKSNPQSSLAEKLRQFEESHPEDPRFASDLNTTVKDHRHSTPDRTVGDRNNGSSSSSSSSKMNRDAEVQRGMRNIIDNDMLSNAMRAATSSSFATLLRGRTPVNSSSRLPIEKAPDNKSLTSEEMLSLTRKWDVSMGVNDQDTPWEISQHLQRYPTMQSNQTAHPLRALGEKPLHTGDEDTQSTPMVAITQLPLFQEKFAHWRKTYVPDDFGTDNSSMPDS